MTLQLDHVVIAVQDLDTAIEDYRALGFTVRRGGVHANRATHNALITFADGTYLELLAATGELPILGLINFGVLLGQGEGLAGFALRADDLETESARLRAEGFAVGQVIPGERRREDGTLLRWKLARLDDGFAPFLIQDVTPREGRIPTDPAVTTHANGAAGLRCVEISVRDTAAAQDRYARLLGLPLETDQASRCIVAVEEMAERAGALFALQLDRDRAGDDVFTLERTHGVRFR
jgi:catechol 2,3-dioxygenase-like lactoylglutathione lyase family enzyme